MLRHAFFRCATHVGCGCYIWLMTLSFCSAPWAHRRDSLVDANIPIPRQASGSCAYFSFSVLMLNDLHCGFMPRLWPSTRGARINRPMSEAILFDGHWAIILGILIQMPPIRNCIKESILHVLVNFLAAWANLRADFGLTFPERRCLLLIYKRLL